VDSFSLQAPPGLEYVAFRYCITGVTLYPQGTLDQAHPHSQLPSRSARCAHAVAVPARPGGALRQDSPTPNRPLGNGYALQEDANVKIRISRRAC
jgi:hypothetical protein